MKPRLYNIWIKMRNRCNNKNNEAYEWYGGKGVGYCLDWETYSNFEKWALSNGYNKDLTLDRINGNLNYEPNNCRWITRKEQTRNRSTNKFITYNNKTLCLADWAQTLGIKKSTIIDRARQNLPIEDILYKGNLRGKVSIA
jgi:hypothetical protein